MLWGARTEIQLDRSISYLQMVSRLDANDPSVLTDLSAAYLVRAARRHDASDIVAAMDAAARAVALDEHNAAATYNLALSLDAFGLGSDAGNEWRRYIQIDSTSGWATEARARADGLGRVIRPIRSADNASRDAASPLALRKLGWNHLLGEWGQAELAGDTTLARRALDSAAAIGRKFVRDGGDLTLSAELRVITRRPDGASRDSLAAACVAFAQGRASHDAADYPRAFALLQRAAKLSGVTPLAEWSRVFAASSLIYLGREAEAESMLRRVIARADASDAPALLGRARWVLGTTLLREGDIGTAAVEFRASEDLFLRIGEPENAGAVRALVADAEFSMGDWRHGFASTQAALAILSAFPQSLWVHNARTKAAETAASAGMPFAAVLIQDDGVAVAEATGQPMYVAESRLVRARLLTAVNQPKEAIADLDSARFIADRLSAGTLRTWLLGDIELTTGIALLHKSPRQAASALDSAVHVFSTLRVVPRLLPALLSEADAQFRSSDARTAMTTLDTAINILRDERRTIGSAVVRASLIDAERSVFDDKVMYLLASHDTVRALAALECARIHRARADASCDAAGPDTRRLRHDQLIVDYALIGDTLLAWAISRDGVSLERKAINRDELLRWVTRAQVLIQTGTQERVTAPVLADLYDLLLSPVRRGVDGPIRSLIVVADGDIAGAPFPALYDRGRSLYAIQEVSLRFAPTLGDALQVPKSDNGGRVAFVADPAFDQHVFPGVDRLQGATEEVEQVRRFAPQSSELTGAAATVPATVRAAERADVLYFAGHAYFDETRPSESFLVLSSAGSDGTNGRLTAANIERLPLQHLKLVILSACETFRERDGHSAGMSGLTGAFLAAGARGVVGTSWRVNDETTREFMVVFYKDYEHSQDAAEALAAAQRTFINSPNAELRNPKRWAAFRYSGS